MSNFNKLHSKLDKLLHSLDLINDITTYLANLEYIDMRNMSVSNYHNGDDTITISIDKDDIISPLISTVRYDLRIYSNEQKLINTESELSFTGVFTKKTIQKDIIVKIDINYCSDGNIIWFSDCDFYFERVSCLI